MGEIFLRETGRKSSFQCTTRKVGWERFATESVDLWYGVVEIITVKSFYDNKTEHKA